MLQFNLVWTALQFEALLFHLLPSLWWKSRSHRLIDLPHIVHFPLCLRTASSPAPLIRSAIEIVVMRTILNTDYSIKYRNMHVLMDKCLILNDILSAADTLKIKLQFGTDCIRKLYAWGSISMHYALTMKHHEIWNALRFVQNLPSTGLIICQDDQQWRHIDSILDYLFANGKIEVQWITP